MGTPTAHLFPYTPLRHADTGGLINIENIFRRRHVCPRWRRGYLLYVVWRVLMAMPKLGQLALEEGYVPLPQV